MPESIALKQDRNGTACLQSNFEACGLDEGGRGGGGGVEERW